MPGPPRDSDTEQVKAFLRHGHPWLGFGVVILSRLAKPALIAAIATGAGTIYRTIASS